MANLSEIAKFHNQKEPDFNPETGVIFEPGTKEYCKFIQYKEKFKREQEIGSPNEAISAIQTTLEAIEKAKLKEAERSDYDQINLLAKRIETARSMIESTLNNIKEYIEAIRSRLEIEDYTEIKNIDQIKSADEFQSLKHNSLINNIRSTIKYISHTFANIDEEAIEEWNERLEERNTPILHVERINLPKNIICPDHLNLNDRHQIADWAKQVYEFLITINKKSPSN